MSVVVPDNWPEITVAAFSEMKRLNRDINPNILEKHLQKAVDEAVSQFEIDNVTTPFSELNQRYFINGIYDIAYAEYILELRKDRKFKSGGEEEPEVDDQIKEEGWSMIRRIPGFVENYHFELL